MVTDLSIMVRVLVCSLISSSLYVANASEEVDQYGSRPLINSPKDFEVKVNTGFESLPVDILARILVEAAEGDGAKLSGFGTVSKSFKTAADKALKTQTMAITTDMILPSDIAKLRKMGFLELKLIEPEKSLSPEEWNEKLKLVGQLTNLVGLDLSNTNVSNIESLKGLKKLIYLDLSNTQVDNLAPLDGMTSLLKLDISKTKAVDISSLKNLVNLVQLNLSGNGIKLIEPIRYLTRLRMLNISWNPIEDLGSTPEAVDDEIKASPLSLLNNLVFLNLSGTNFKETSVLSDKTNLAGLFIDNTLVDDISALANLKQLLALRIDGTLRDLSPLYSLSRLEQISIYGPYADSRYFNREQLDQLSERLPNAKLTFLTNPKRKDIPERRWH